MRDSENYGEIAEMRERARVCDQDRERERERERVPKSLFGSYSHKTRFVVQPTLEGW